MVKNRNLRISLDSIEKDVLEMLKKDRVNIKKIKEMFINQKMAIFLINKLDNNSHIEKQIEDNQIFYKMKNE